MKRIFSFDAETDGLWGDPFAVAAIVYEEKFTMDGSQWQASGLKTRPKQWVEVDQICLRLPDFRITNPWTIENILPTLEGIAVTHTDYIKMLADFATFYLKYRSECDVICHMGYIVEAHLLREIHKYGFIGDWEGPYPLFDVSGNLQSAGEDPTSVDAYVQKYNLKISDYGTTHNPLYDCEVTAKVYIHLNELK